MSEGTFFGLAALLLLASCSVNSAIEANYEGKAKLALATHCQTDKD
jgi:hypothetical protein